jgi:hypothetical protein
LLVPSCLIDWGVKVLLNDGLMKVIFLCLLSQPADKSGIEHHRNKKQGVTETMKPELLRQQHPTSLGSRNSRTARLAILKEN